MERQQREQEEKKRLEIERQGMCVNEMVCSNPHSQHKTFQVLRGLFGPEACGFWPEWG